MPRTNTDPVTVRTTWAERCVVLGGFVAAAFCTILAFLHAGGLEAVAALWLAAAVWAVLSSLAFALRRGLRNSDWSAFGRYEITDSNELIDWSYGNGIFMGRWYGQPPETLEFCYL